VLDNQAKPEVLNNYQKAGYIKRIYIRCCAYSCVYSCVYTSYEGLDRIEGKVQLKKLEIVVSVNLNIV